MGEEETAGNKPASCGTNFGDTPMYRQTNFHDYDAPVSETGRLTDKGRASRRVALWAKTFKEILLSGEHRRDVRATGGLRVTETATREHGSIVFVDNPDAETTITGSVFPYLPEVTLGPRELFPYVHDFPIGATGRYLSAYVGLVKSDAPVLTAHILPDPYDGARVYVYGNPGETREVALFNGNDRGRGVPVTFAEAPRVYPVGPSQVIALSTEMAGRVWIHPDDENTPVLIGPDDVRDHGTEEAIVEVAPDRAHTLYSLRPDGSLTEINVEAPPLPAPPALSAWKTIAEPDYAAPDFDDSDWLELDDVATQGNMIALNIAQNGPAHGSNPYGWYRARVQMDDASDAQLHFAACSDRLTLFANGERVGSSPVPPEDRRGDWTATFDLRLKAGENVLCVLADNLGLIMDDRQIGKGQEHEKKGIYGPVTLTPSGGCYQIDVTRWRFRGLLHGERGGWFNYPSPTAWERAGGGGEGRAKDESALIRWHRATFTLDNVPDSAMPLLARLDGMGKGVAWLNGHNLGRYWQTGGPQRDYYLPEPWLQAGENVLVLAETEGNAPESATLVWDARSAAVVRVLL